MSVRQAHMLSSLLQETGVNWNKSWDGRAAVIHGEELPVAEMPNGLLVTLLSPTSRELKEMGDLWRREKVKLSPDVSEEEQVSSKGPPGGMEEKEGRGDPGIARSDRKTATRRAARTGWSAEDIESLAALPFRGDGSTANASSIAILAEFGGASLLVGGDARADVLAGSLRKILKRRGLRRLPLDAFVVPHAGSRGNLSVELLELIECDRYLFSTDGSRHRHPDPETIARILVHGRAGAGSLPILIFNYRSPTTVVWDSPELQQRYGYKAVYPSSEDGAGIEVVLRGGTMVEPNPSELP